MPIVSVYGKYSTGLQKRKSKGADVTGIKRQAEILLASMTDQFGNRTVEGYQAANAYLAPYKSDPEVALKILQNNNLLFSLADKIIQARTDVSVFRSELDEDINDIAEAFKNDPVGMIYATSDRYFQAEDEYTAVLDLALSRMSSGQKLPNDISNFSEELEQQSDDIALLANSFSGAIVDEEGNLDKSVAAGYGYMIQTNPATGKVTNMWVQPVNSLSKAPSGYSKTNSFVDGTNIPIYLPTIIEGNKVMARIGGITFRSKKEASGGPDEIATMILEQEDTGFFFSKKESNISFGDLSFDKFDIPANTVLRHGLNQFSYLDSKNVLHRVEDINVLSSIIESSGRNADEEINRAFRVSKSYINEKLTSSGPPINKESLGSLVSNLGGGALHTPLPEETRQQLQSSSAFSSRGNANSSVRPQLEQTPYRGPGATSRYGSDIVKGLEETQQKIVGGTKSFFKKVSEGTLFNI